MRRTSDAFARFLLPACASLLLLTACADSGSTEPGTKSPTATPPDSTAPTPPGTSASAPPETSASATPGSSDSTGPAPDEGHYNVELRITVTPEPGAEPQKYLLQCDGTTPSEASNVPKPEAACALVEKSARALFFTKPDPTMQCTQQYGGPQTATVKGTVNGRPVQAEFARTDGCEISRWNAMEPILGAGGVM
ncbi:hypothetical protein [Arthrobacter castelli]|uniref:hypothetical protein n=1 Tax=Arthrobacter castelli TaxID=271431 RepID=UPI00041A480A|nr:hypothetical protein [Arthrobacter castelli]